MKAIPDFWFVFALFLAGITSVYAQTGHYTNPVGDSIPIADPFILQHKGKYYLYGTSAPNRGFKFWTSKNLIDWEPKGFAYQRSKDSWGQKSFWAPEVIPYNGKFYMIYSAQGKTKYGNGLRLCLGVSDSPEGPFIDLYAPLFDNGFSCIDGHLFIDDGMPYLFYEMVGAVGKLNKDGYLWGCIFGTELSKDLSKPTKEPVLCIYPSQNWELNSDRALSTEGMTVFKHKNLYYMTYSANHFKDPDYGIGFAIAGKPLGLWKKSSENPLLKNDLSKKVSGPGHNCVVKSPDGSEWFMAYHSHANSLAPAGERILNIDRLIIHNNGALSVKGPTRTPQVYPNGAGESKN